MVYIKNVSNITAVTVQIKYEISDKSDPRDATRNPVDQNIPDITRNIPPNGTVIVNCANCGSGNATLVSGDRRWWNGYIPLDDLLTLNISPEQGNVFMETSSGNIYIPNSLICSSTSKKDEEIFLKLLSENSKKRTMETYKDSQQGTHSQRPNLSNSRTIFSASNFGYVVCIIAIIILLFLVYKSYQKK